ncbi:hypothetical protein AB5I41_17615 [Sphingomonas sp. MMS24-JH45]
MLVAGIAYGAIELWKSRGDDAWLLAPYVVALCNFLVIKSVPELQEANHPLAFMMLGAVAALVHRSRAARRARAEEERESA